jgi:hypothetical protein
MPLTQPEMILNCSFPAIPCLKLTVLKDKRLQVERRQTLIAFFRHQNGLLILGR